MNSKSENFLEEPENKDESTDNPNFFPHLVINQEDILAAAKKAKRLTAGGLQQITPWLLKRAFLEDTTNECAMIAGQMGKGRFFYSTWGTCC